MDELAAAARVDPVEFRLRHLDDPRARDVITTAALQFGWQMNAKLPRGRGAALPSLATRILPPIARSPSNLRSKGKQAGSSLDVSLRQSMLARRLIMTVSATRSKAPSCSPQAGRTTKK